VNTALVDSVDAVEFVSLSVLTNSALEDSEAVADSAGSLSVLTNTALADSEAVTEFVSETVSD
jgi:hypothetical protein